MRGKTSSHKTHGPVKKLLIKALDPAHTWQLFAIVTVVVVIGVGIKLLAFAATSPNPYLSSTKCSSQPTLREGSSGYCVQAVQWALSRVGGGTYGLARDGSFGPLTYAAVKKFQASRGFQVDGVVGPQTWSGIKLVTGGARVLMSADNLELAACSLGTSRTAYTKMAVEAINRSPYNISSLWLYNDIYPVVGFPVSSGIAVGSGKAATIFPSYVTYDASKVQTGWKYTVPYTKDYNFSASFRGLPGC